MVRVFTKKSTTWTFTLNGAYKENKSGMKTYYPEMKIGSTLGENYIQELEEKEWKELSTQIEREVK